MKHIIDSIQSHLIDAVNAFDLEDTNDKRATDPGRAHSEHHLRTVRCEGRIGEMTVRVDQHRIRPCRASPSA